MNAAVSGSLIATVINVKDQIGGWQGIVIGVVIVVELIWIRALLKAVNGENK